MGGVEAAAMASPKVGRKSKPSIVGFAGGFGNGRGLREEGVGAESY